MARLTARTSSSDAERRNWTSLGSLLEPRTAMARLPRLPVISPTTLDPHLHPQPATVDVRIFSQSLCSASGDPRRRPAASVGIEHIHPAGDASGRSSHAPAGYLESDLPEQVDADFLTRRPLLAHFEGPAAIHRRKTEFRMNLVDHILALGSHELVNLPQLWKEPERLLGERTTRRGVGPRHFGGLFVGETGQSRPARRRKDAAGSIGLEALARQTVHRPSPFFHAVHETDRDIHGKRDHSLADFKQTSEVGRQLLGGLAGLKILDDYEPSAPASIRTRYQTTGRSGRKAARHGTQRLTGPGQRRAYSPSDARRASSTWRITSAGQSATACGSTRSMLTVLICSQWITPGLPSTPAGSRT
jgi:hypothetical protein